MPIVQIDMLQGRTVDQKREMVKKITDVIVETAQCPPQAVTIVIREMAAEHLGTAGILRVDKQ